MSSAPIRAIRCFSVSPFDVLEDDVGVAAVLAGVDHRDDVGVGELGDRARLLAEALELVGLLGHLAVHHLDRDRPVEGLVVGQVDGRHAAAAELRLQPVAAGEHGADHLGAGRACIHVVREFVGRAFGLRLRVLRSRGSVEGFGAARGSPAQTRGRRISPEPSYRTTDPLRRRVVLAQEVQGRVLVRRGDDDAEAAAHVEDVVHLLVGDAAPLADQLEDRLGPAAGRRSRSRPRRGEAQQVAECRRR